MIESISKDNDIKTHKTNINDTIFACPKFFNKIPIFSLLIRNKKVQIEIDCKDWFNSAMDFDDYLSTLEKVALHYCTRQYNHQLQLTKTALIARNGSVVNV